MRLLLGPLKTADQTLGNDLSATPKYRLPRFRRLGLMLLLPVWNKTDMEMSTARASNTLH
jgi:hypothetical protein